MSPGQDEEEKRGRVLVDLVPGLVPTHQYLKKYQYQQVTSYANYSASVPGPFFLKVLRPDLLAEVEWRRHGIT